MIGGALSGWPRSFAAELPWLDPDWLQAHVGEGEGQIAPVVLQRARALYLKKVSEGAVNNPCYFAMDATRPGGLGRRFYIICEADRTFRAVPSGHGDGRNLEGVADFANGIRCAKNFSNAMDSQLTTGGPYVTAEIRTSFKGYYRDPGGNSVALMRSFVQFDGEGDAANVAWVQQFIAAMQPWSDGSRYLNFAGFQEEGDAMMRDSWGAQYERLRELKATYDPTNLFSLNQNIKPRQD